MRSRQLPRTRVVTGGSLQKYLLIAIGGALGSVARYWVGATIGGRMGARFPYGTFVINLTACVIIGFSMTWLGRRAELSPAWRFLIPVGFIGAYSTFSTYEWETLSTLRAGAFGIAALYAIGSFAAGLESAGDSKQMTEEGPSCRTSPAPGFDGCGRSNARSSSARSTTT